MSSLAHCTSHLNLHSPHLILYKGSVVSMDRTCFYSFPYTKTQCSHSGSRESNSDHAVIAGGSHTDRVNTNALWGFLWGACADLVWTLCGSCTTLARTLFGKRVEPGWAHKHKLNGHVHMSFPFHERWHLKTGVI